MPRWAAAAASAAWPTSHSSKSGSAGVSDSSAYVPESSNAGLLPGGGQDRALGERVRLAAGQEDQRRLAVLDPLVVGLHQHGPAVGMQRRDVATGLIGIGEPLCTNGSRTDRGLDHDLARGQRTRSPGAKNRLGIVGTPASARSAR